MGSGGIGCGASIAKYLLFLFNIVFFLAGAALMGVGIWIRVDPRSAQFARVLAPTTGAGDPLIQAAAIIIAIIGGVVLIIGFFGCAGACCENTCMLTTYATIVIILALAQIAAGITAAVFSGRIQNFIGNAMNDGMVRYTTSEPVQRAWDSMQVWLECCGRNSSSDWDAPNLQVRGRTNYPNWTRNYPPSCCKMKDRNPDKIRDDNMKQAAECRRGDLPAVNTQGCEQSLLNWFRRNAGIIMGIAFGLVVIQFVVAFMACCLKKAIHEEKHGVV